MNAVSRFVFENGCEGAKNDAMIRGSAENEATGRKASYGGESRKKVKKLFDAALKTGI